jgi:hypothetical protein
VSNGDFTLNKQAINTIGVNGTAEFTVVPNTGLAEGTHNATVTVSGGNNISAEFSVTFPVKAIAVSSFEALVTRMAEDKDSASASYILSGEAETYTAVTLTSANCPATVVLDGNGGVITGNGHIDGVVVGAGLSLTVKNAIFKNLKFTVRDGGTLMLEDGAVLRENGGSGVTVGNGGFLEMKDGSLVEANGYSGILMYGTGGSFTMDGGTVSGNYCSQGGGVRIEGQGSVFTMKGGLISSNRAGNGGGAGVSLYGANTVFNLEGGEISGNSSENTGGSGVLVGGNNAKFTMSGGLISGNISEYGKNSGTGGGVSLERGSFTMKGGTISGNKAYYGGGVMLWNGTNAIFDMEDGLITGNTAELHGGGVYAMSGSTVNMTGGEITDNSAVKSGGGLYLYGSPTLSGDPQIGGDTAPNGGGWIHGNTPTDR